MSGQLSILVKFNIKYRRAIRRFIGDFPLTAGFDKTQSVRGGVKIQFLVLRTGNGPLVFIADIVYVDGITGLSSSGPNDLF